MEFSCKLSHSLRFHHHWILILRGHFTLNRTNVAQIYFCFTKIGLFHCFYSRYNLQEACCCLGPLPSGRVSRVYILHHKGKWFCDKKIKFTLPSQFWRDKRRGTCREPAGLASHQLVLYGTPAPHHVLGELQMSCKVASFLEM